MIEELSEIPVTLGILIITLLLIQATWMFYDASKRGEPKWIWGFFGMINVPSSLIIYLVTTRVIMKKQTCPHCEKYIEMKSTFCSQCGSKINEKN
ncbi:zinc-ribbon domain-containing protein [Serpentinicella sp. ANB-PHB4]|uniref:zinc-ribbon domain-containing protein n=1 Tax=Serpentinicella sp. ANB-PHB4 TaxID=3074076 RepID=UPI00285A3671|nr:zinc-ribbon domain-containing protein [Serpentinicella sp. ANB-PHB4]MDR5659274.1 zinc-ribbon domain-containing protein [Serpentinicella sp. ANB-PHB4]